MKWVHPVIAKRVVVTPARNVVVTMMAPVETAKTAAAVGDQKARREAMAPAVKPTTTVLAVCGVMDHRVGMVRPAMPKKAVIIADQTVRPVAMDHPQRMAITANMALDPMGTTIRIPVEINKKPAKSPKPRFRILSLAPGPASLLVPANTGPGCFISEPAARL
jgi:hypothetical protein